MSYALLLSKLNNVRKTTPRTGLCESHRAECPVCSGHSTSLSIALTDDNRILVNCFAHGCNYAEVANSVGIDPADLMPDRISSAANPIKFKSPTEWQSVSSLSDAVSWAAAVASIDPSEANLAMVVGFADALNRAAKTAMRGGAR